MSTHTAAPAATAEPKSQPSEPARSAEPLRPVLLGESPSRAGDRYWMFPLSGRPAERILEWLEIPYEGAAYWELIEHFETLNVIERYRDAVPWSVERARARWTRWVRSRREEAQQRLVVVCLGRRAADAVGLHGEQPWGRWLDVGLLSATVIPHTSGRNLVYNDPEMVELAKRVLREALEKARD